MKKTRIIGLSAALMLIASAANAQIGNPFIHDPSTVVECDGKYYTFGTGGGGLISPDGWHWESGAVRPGGGVAPDAMKIGDRYLVVYSSGVQGSKLQHHSRVYALWYNTLDPNAPDFKITDPIDIAGSTGYDDCDGIDPGLLMGPDGRLWLVYGTYYGYIRVVELDPATAKAKGEPKDIALSCEAAEMTYYDGWYYLLATHGTCCAGANSTYTIIAGRSKSPQGPFVDNLGRDMMQGGGKYVLSSEPRRIGAGHFGRFDIAEGIQKMSFHFEADLDLSGKSTLAIRPLMWKNGWPVAGELIDETCTYGIQSERRGYVLELACDFVRMNNGGGWRRVADAPIVKSPSQKLEDINANWPSGDMEVRLGADIIRPHQTWTITSVPDAGGYLGGAYYKIAIEGTDRALEATADKDVKAAPSFTGADSQLWRIDQLIDGTYRIMPKAVPGTSEELVLMTVADSTPTLGAFNFNDDNSKWNLKKH